ncbi:MAG TPA: T9SS type A sorting domain-containing protein [Flavobacteriales bacterium]|nr:T9SS type A sorting domain-containing protein [Flavobacteriales bacterium]
MKKTTTIIASLLIAVGMTAQIVPGQNHNGLLKAKNDKITMSGDEVLSYLIVNPNPHTSAVLNSKSTMTETLIGTTTYDLQSNAAVQNRILRHSDGSISTAWTMSQQYNTSYSDRGTGYNFFDGTTWGAQPTTRLEGSRGGWPSILKMGSGKETSITHNTDNSYVNMAHRATTGSGTWADQIISSSDSNGVYRYMIWNRSAVGGLNNETIHMVALTAPTGNGGATYNGLDGALLYYRSQDEGVTWDRKDIQLPGMDTSMFIGMSGDVYAIAAQGETVVVAYFDDWGDSFIVKSTDNGDTWTKTTFLDFPVEKYAMDDGLDLDGDGILDQVYSSDNNGAVILDATGQAHVFYGIMMYVDDDLTDGSSSWYPSINGLAYWNESFGADMTPATMHAGDTSLWYSDMMNDHWITEVPDLDGDGIVGGVDSTGGYALYYNSRASMPNAGFSANGEIYLSFSGYTETASTSTQVFRHIYITKSSDGGTTWKDPVDVTPHTIWGGAQECVFASMNPVVDDKIRIVYQKDFEPGLAVRGDEDMVDNNEIIYLEIDTVGLFDTPLAITQITSSTHFSVYPNPATNFTTLEISSDKTQTIKISVFDLLGKEITKKEKVIFSGTTLETINISEYQNGIYFVNLQIGTQVITKKLVITN